MTAMAERSSNGIHRVTSWVLWIVLAVLTASAIYAACIAIVNWKHIGV
jgi:hypothetical protein